MVEIAPEGEWNATLLLLHGLGASGQDLAALVPPLRQILPAGLASGLKVLCPDAPVQPVTINGGMPMRSWFDIRGLDRDDPVDTAGIDAATARARQWLNEPIRRHGKERCFVGGFSQGGVVALHAALGHEEPLGGVFGLSTWLPAAERLPAPARHATLPVFLAHGLQDDLVRPAALNGMIEWLHDRGYTSVESQLHDGGHAIPPEVVAALGQWLGCVVSSNP
ncbi:MAG: alpha/beta hydrolase [Halothiobacillaceae bacterium]